MLLVLVPFYFNVLPPFVYLVSLSFSLRKVGGSIVVDYLSLIE
ncbi:hypothetical protein VIBNISFn27_200014 [Vibrio nigripulchritudo SFn27]|uniref:Uncharacterized protein n=1 Tax=Vibrio nigripulchritudo TaxID=28173 RepID=U4K8M6_9VIBR|nr:hypothetical protein VIBNIBLFn1_140015 [Vibrio nigripulchritudo BLFn1]CCN87930.1 hypothetical protein VIBNISFn27_200014 [Vibrio nigripulchritudo SFn27]CCN96280.1 hypothetical protein VIBNIENn2_730031 [Vibrio nigripulchritudo ENn2]CCO42149.1 hypothetical protein VIBNISFn135_760013 [Vibrio nigripulchritudo SFn135]CCO55291.1 hypothetical protein VIBNIWn13_800014 [Vibrio nigripulchritudo Wn13]CCO61707.1 hypothetical protein VIBNI_B1994 [Vibrio nigripulchritudo]